MSNTIDIIKKACDSLNLNYTNIDQSGVFIEVHFENKKHLFIANNLGLNNEVVEKVCRDKYYTYSLLNSVANIPITTSCVDSNPPELYKSYSSYKSNDEVANSITDIHNFPVVLKPNSKSMGVNVFKCDTGEEVKNAISVIFNKDSYKYDHVLLAQDFVEIESEYRVLTYKKQIQFFYKKDNVGAEFNGNLSPLHFKNAKAVLIEDQALQSELQEFINPVFEKLNLVYAGFDIAKDKDGKLWLFEINSKPGFNYFIRDSSDEVVVKMFKSILTDLQKTI